MASCTPCEKHWWPGPCFGKCPYCYSDKRIAELETALLYIGDKAVVDWDDTTVNEVDTMVAKSTYKEAYVKMMKDYERLKKAESEATNRPWL